MKELPPDEHGEHGEDGVDELYRRASSREVSRPSESVRRAVLRHAADLASNRASAKRPVDIDFKQPATNQSWRRPAAYGGLAAAALAGLLIAPRFFTLSSPPMQVAKMAPPVDAPTAAGATAAAPAPTAPAPARESDAFSGPPMGSGSSGNLRRDRRTFAAKSSATYAPHAEESVSSDRALVEIAPPPPPAAPPPAAPSPPAASPAASIGGRAVASPLDAASALRQAAAVGDLSRVRALLAEQPEIDARDSAGRSALMLAAMYGQTDAVELLLASGADANAADSNGTTPMQAALARKRSAVVDALRRAGAR